MSGKNPVMSHAYKYKHVLYIIHTFIHIICMCERERSKRVKSLSKFAGTIKDYSVDFKTVTTAAQSQRHKHAAARFFFGILRTGGKYSRLMKSPLTSTTMNL